MFVCASALCARRGDQLQRGRVRLRRGAGEEGAGSDARTRRRGLYLLGRARRIFDAVEHGHEARVGTPGEIPAQGGELQKENRLQGTVLYRAEAEGADEASI